MKIPFNRVQISEKEYEFIKDLFDNISNFSNDKLCGDGRYTSLCTNWLKEKFNSDFLLTTSCSSALDMMGLLLDDTHQGGGVIMPSFTFVSTANAFALRGLTPTFVDIREDTCNIDENLIENAIDENTVAICPVHYAGVSCNMDKILQIAQKYNLKVFEDAAQGIGSKYKNQFLGTIGDLGTYSFHETKNIVAGEGGCLIVNNKQFLERAEIIREKGTNRSQFFRGQTDKYTWVDIGSSFLPSEIIAAFLYGQFLNYDNIQNNRKKIWDTYYNFFEKYEDSGVITRPVIPDDCTHNAHMFYIRFNNLSMRTKFINFMKDNNILSVFHYVPLHSAPAGIKYGKVASSMDITNKVSDTLVRLPLFANMSMEELNYILSSLEKFFNGISK